MAGARDDLPESLESIETDAAPSAPYLNIDTLGLGSECEIKTEPKLGEIKEENDVVATQINHAEQFKGVTALMPKTLNGNLETGLGSLNLGEKVLLEPQEVDAKENVYADELLQRDNDGDTSLHLAIITVLETIALSMIDVMLEFGVSLDIENNMHQSPLHLAVLTQQPEVVNCLLKGGASVFQRDHQLRTPMLIACEKNNMAMLKLLISYCIPCLTDHGPSSMLLNPNINPLDLPNADGERCLHIAVRENNAAMAKMLIDNGAEPNLPDRKSGRTALHEAADRNHVDMVIYLISREEVDVNETTYNDETALEIAHMRERAEIVSLLKSKSLPITKRKTKTDTSTS